MNCRHVREKLIPELEIAIHSLQARLGPHSRFVRPFVCDGALVDCHVFIVGLNAANRDTPFWQYWDGARFDKAAWEQRYLWQRYRRAIQRSAVGERAPRIAGQVRRNIDTLIAHLGVPALETNVYPVATASAEELARLQAANPAFSDTGILDKLMALLPRAVILHGEGAGQYARNLFHVDIAGDSAPEAFTQVTYPDTNCVAYLKGLRHLRTGYAHEYLQPLGRRVRELLAED